MNVQNTKRHTIDFLFPVTLFFLFTIFALLILLFAADSYQSSVARSSRNFNARTSLSYVAEKVHQNDRSSCVSVGSFDGCNALRFTQNYNGNTYYTYIYAHEQALKELFIKEGTKADASNGTVILEIDSFSIEQIHPHLLKFQCTDQNGQSASMFVGLQCEGAEPSKERNDFLCIPENAPELPVCF